MSSLCAKKVLIINDISDARSLLKNKRLIAKEGFFLLSTHVSVDTFLEDHKVSCTFLGKYIEPQEVARNIQLADARTSEIIDDLDRIFSERLNNAAGLKGVRFFHALYSHIIYQRYIVYLNLIKGLEEAIGKLGIEEIVFFNKKLDFQFETATTLSDVLRYFKNIKYESIEPEEVRRSRPRVSRYLLKITKTFQYPHLFLRHLLRIFRKELRFNARLFKKGRPTILLFELLFDLDFFFDIKEGFNVLYYKSLSSLLPNGLKKKSPPIPRIELDFREYISARTSNGDKFRFINDLMVKDIGSDFNNKINRYLPYLLALEPLRKEYPIELGIWGAPPISDFKGLVFEYLLANRIPVIGCQHGGLLGNLYNSDVYFACAGRCTHYITYGFTKDDLRKTYPQRNFDQVEFFSFGTTKTVNINPHKRPVIDILFPIIDTSSMLVTGMIREKPNTLLEKQISLLEYFDTLADKHIIFKPFQYSDQDTLAVFPLLKKMKHVKTIPNLSLLEALEIFDVKIVVIDLPSTSLYEVLPYDLEIFMLGDGQVRPIEQGALDELKKRVHYSESTAGLINLLGAFLQGRLGRKRDDTFYRHYVYKEGAKEKITGLINELSVR